MRDGSLYRELELSNIDLLTRTSALHNLLNSNVEYSIEYVQARIEDIDDELN